MCDLPHAIWLNPNVVHTESCVFQPCRRKTLDWGGLAGLPHKRETHDRRWSITAHGGSWSGHRCTGSQAHSCDLTQINQQNFGVNSSPNCKFKFWEGQWLASVVAPAKHRHSRHGLEADDGVRLRCRGSTWDHIWRADECYDLQHGATPRCSRQFDGEQAVVHNLAVAGTTPLVLAAAHDKCSSHHTLTSVCRCGRTAAMMFTTAT